MNKNVSKIIKAALQMNNRKNYTPRRRIATKDIPDNDRMVWVDLEMTGLDLDKCHIMEVACVVTDGNLNPVDEGLHIVIHQPEEILASMNDWCKKHHNVSGLTQLCRDSKISLQQAEFQLLSHVRRLTPAKQCQLAGNSVHEDRRFLCKYMPEFIDHLHYRIIDVSTIKELARRWYPSTYEQVIPRKGYKHRALDDIYDSIEELRFYKEHLFPKTLPVPTTSE